MTHWRTPTHLRALGQFLRLALGVVSALVAFVLAAYLVAGALSWK